MEGFPKRHIELIRRMILDTKLQPDGPSHAISSSLSAWLVDADLANLGRSDFLEQTKLLAEELNIPMSLMLNESLTLMNRHPTAQSRRKSDLRKTRSEQSYYAEYD